MLEAYRSSVWTRTPVEVHAGLASVRALVHDQGDGPSGEGVADPGGRGRTCRSSTVTRSPSSTSRSASRPRPHAWGDQSRVTNNVTGVVPAVGRRDAPGTLCEFSISRT